MSHRGPVVYLAMEDGTVELARRLTQRGYKPADALGVSYRFAWSLVRELSALNEVEEVEQIEPIKPEEGMGRPSPIYRVTNPAERLIY